MHSLFSLHQIRQEGRFGFLPADYSRFKFGDGAVATAFGTALADGFIRHTLAGRAVVGQLVVVSSPYAFIPTATYGMKSAFVSRLNRWLAHQGFPVVQETKVHRTVTYKEDYGALTAEQRLRLISNDSFHIDRHFLEGKELVFLDDIKITGSHQRMIEKMIAAYELTNPVHMVYFAELINGRIHPNIENFLNYYTVKSIFDLNDIIRSGNFLINTRIVKYILSADPDCFRLFMGDQENSFTELLYDMAIGNGYHLIDAYSHNLHHLKTQILHTHNLVTNGNQSSEGAAAEYQRS